MGEFSVCNSSSKLGKSCMSIMYSISRTRIAREVIVILVDSPECVVE